VVVILLELIYHLLIDHLPPAALLEGDQVALGVQNNAGETLSLARAEVLQADPPHPWQPRPGVLLPQMK